MLAPPQSAIPASTALLFHVEIPATGALAQDPVELVTFGHFRHKTKDSTACLKLRHTFWRIFYPRFWLLVKFRGETWSSIATSAARDHGSDRWVGVSTCELRKWKGFAKQFGQVRGSIWFDLVGSGFGVPHLWNQMDMLALGTQNWMICKLKTCQVAKLECEQQLQDGRGLHLLMLAVSICLLYRTGNPSCQKPLCQFYVQTDPGHWSRKIWKVFRQDKMHDNGKTVHEKLIHMTHPERERLGE